MTYKFSKSIEIEICGSFPLNLLKLPELEREASVIPASIRSMNFVRDILNKDRNKNRFKVKNESISLSVKIEDNQLNLTLFRQQVQQFKNDGCVALIAPGLIGKMSAEANKIANSVQIPMITLDNSLPAFSNDYVLDAFPAIIYNMETTFPLLRIKNLKNIEIWVASTPDYDFFPFVSPAIEKSKDNNVVVTKIVSYPVASPFFLVPSTPEIQANISSEVTLLKKRINQEKIDGLLIIGGSQHNVVKELKRQNISPKMIINYPLWLSWGDVKPTLSEYLLGVTFPSTNILDPQPTYSSDLFFGSFHNFIREFNESQGIIPGEGEPILSYFISFIIQAIHASQSLDPQDIINTIQFTTFETSIGPFSYDIRGNQRWPLFVIQYQNHRKEIVAPLRTQTKDLIFPFPKWNERVLNLKCCNTSEIVVFIIMSIFILSSIISIFFVIMYRNNDVIKAGSPAFLILSAIGSIILYSSVFSFAPNLISNFMCNYKIFAVSLGFCLMLGALFSKSWRIYKLYYNSSVEVIAIPDTHVWLITGLLFSLVLILSIFLFSFANVKSIEIINDPIRRGLNEKGCTTGTTYWILLGIIISVNAIISCWGIYVSYHLRKIHFKAYNESSFLIFSLYNILFFAILVTILLVVDINGNTKFIVVSLIIITGTSLTILPLFTSKILMICRGENATSRRTSDSISRNPSNKSKSINTMEEIDDLRTDIKELKEQLENEKANSARYKEELRKVKMVERDDSLSDIDNKTN